MWKQAQQLLTVEDEDDEGEECVGCIPAKRSRLWMSLCEGSTRADSHRHAWQVAAATLIAGCQAKPTACMLLACIHTYDAP